MTTQNLERKPLSKRPLKTRIHLALRSAHIYGSMLSLIFLCFFASSGILLNHPEWVGKNAEITKTYQGSLPKTWQNSGKPDWLVCVEHLRFHHPMIKGRAEAFQYDPEESSVSFKAPGYSADVVIETQTGNYVLETHVQGLLNIIGDLHRGKNTGTSWSWLIDFTGWFLLVVSLTGLGMMCYLKKMRKAFFMTVGATSILCFIMIGLTFNR